MTYIVLSLFTLILTLLVIFQNPFIYEKQKIISVMLSLEGKEHWFVE